MEEVRFIDRAPDCRACALELRDAPRRKLEQIMQERGKHDKCKGCERLKEEKEKAGSPA